MHADFCFDELHDQLLCDNNRRKNDIRTGLSGCPPNRRHPHRRSPVQAFHEREHGNHEGKAGCPENGQGRQPFDRLLKNSVQCASLPLIGSFTEERQRTDRGLAAAGYPPKRLCAFPRQSFNSLPRNLSTVFLPQLQPRPRLRPSSTRPGLRECRARRQRPLPAARPWGCSSRPQRRPRPAVSAGSARPSRGSRQRSARQGPARY